MNQLQGKFLLPWIYSFIQWVQMFVILLEELISVLSVPLLSFGVSISLIDFFMHGTLSKDTQFAYTWSVIQAISIDAQIAFTWYKAKVAWQTKNYKAFLGFLLIGIIIGFVVWAASSLQGLTIESNSAQNETQNLASFGLSPSVLIGARQGVAVILLCIAGWTRKLVDELANQGGKKEVKVASPKGSFWAWIWSVITVRKVRDFMAKKSLERKQKRTQKNASANPANTQNSTGVPQPKITKELDPKDLENLPLKREKSPRKPVAKMPKLNKNIYTKKEAASLARCSEFEIEKAIKDGDLAVSKNGKGILKSSLEKFIVARQKEQEKAAV